MKNSSSPEKQWIRQMLNGQSHTAPTEAKTQTEKSAAAAPISQPPAPKKGHGFDDIAGMEEQKRLVREGFINVLNNREMAQAYGILPPSLMLYGPSGCGKTHFARAVANELGVNFMEIVPDDIASKWVHGTQEKIAEVFRKAEKNAPTLLFFDEFDAMVPVRTSEDRHHQNNEVNEFLCMMNNAQEKGVYVIVATNHPENIDRAVLRTGRIDEMIYIDMPDSSARKDLFAHALAKLPASENIDYEKLAAMTSGYSCSDITYIIKVASRKKFNETIQHKDEPYRLISQMELEEAIKQQVPSVSPRELRAYERIRNEFSPKDQGRKAVAIGFNR